MTERKVRFVEERSVPKELEKLERFAGVFRYFAAVWDVDIFVDAPGGKPVLPIEEEDKGVFIHVYSVAGHPYGPLQFSRARTMFGWPVPQPSGSANDDSGGEIVRGDNVGACFSYPSTTRAIKQTQRITTPEENTVAEIVSANIYILFDIARDPWDGDTLVLWHILAASFAKMRGDTELESAWGRELGLRGVLHEKLVQSFKDEGLERFTHLCQFAVGSRFSECEKDERRTQIEIDDARSIIMKLGFESMEIDAYLRHGDALAAARYNAGEQFDTLISWGVVKGVRIEDRPSVAESKPEPEKTMQDKRMVVYTNPLTMERPDGRRFLIGEYIIVIDPVIPGNASAPFLNNFEQWVQAAEYGWRGPYRHSFILSALETYCWGSMISPAVVTALTASNFVFAIQDAFVFLQSESGGGHGKPTQEDLACRPPAPSPIYTDESDRVREREQFKEFVEYYRAKTTTEARKERQTDIAAQLKSKVEELAGAEVSLEEIQYKLAFLRHCMHNVPIEEEYSRLTNNPGLVGCGIYANAMWAVFAPRLDTASPRTMHGGLGIRVTASGEVKVYEMAESKPVDRTIANEYAALRQFIELGMLGSAICVMRELSIGVSAAYYQTYTKVLNILHENASGAAKEIMGG